MVQHSALNMEYNKFTFDDIDVGDGVYFDSVYSSDNQLLQLNFGVFWLVIKKEDTHVRLCLLGYENCFWNCKYSEIKAIQKVF